MPAFATPLQTIKPRTPGWRPGERVPGEYYPTPREAITALLAVERLDGSVWEPACGDGRIGDILRARGHFVVCTDLYDRGGGESGVDFLKQTAPRARNIMTNPPYGSGLADRFVDRALALTAQTGGKVVMLLNLASLCHPPRTAWWQRHPPARIYGVDECICWDEAQLGPKWWPGIRQRYIWAVWETGHTGPSSFWWLPVQKYGKPAF